MIEYATGDGLTSMESPHPQFVDAKPTPNVTLFESCGPLTLAEWRARIEDQNRSTNRPSLTERAQYEMGR